VAYTQAARFSFTIVDELGVEAANTYYAVMDPTQTIAAAVTAWTDLYNVLQPVTDGSIVRGHVDILLEPGSISPAVAGSRVEQTGLFNFSATGTTHKFGEPVPAFSSSFITTTGINLSDSTVAAFYNFLATTLTVLEWTSNNQQKLIALLDAVLSFRKRRKQLTRSTFEEA
jgi:hypothetical protein